MRAARNRGFTDPLTDYPRSVGQVITAGAFIPNGHWPAEYDGGYLFADAGSGNMWLRHADGSIDYAAPFATDVGGIADMAFVTDLESIALYYTMTGGQVRKISRPTVPFAAPGALSFVAVPPRHPGARHPAADRRRQACTSQHHALRVHGRQPRSDQGRAGQLRVRRAEHLRIPDGLGRSKRPSGGVESQRLPRRGRGQLGGRAGRCQRRHLDLCVLDGARRHRPARLLQRCPGAVGAGRFVAISPNRISDTRLPVSATNQFTRGVGTQLPFVRVPVAGRGGMPAVAAMDAAVLVVTAVTAADTGGGFLSAESGRRAVLGLVTPQHQRVR